MPDNNDNTILHELLMLQKESNERDTRIEGKMDSLDTRMQYIEAHSEKQDIQLDRLAEILTKQTHLSDKIEVVEKTLENHSKILETQNQSILELKTKSGKVALSVWQMIGGIFLTAVVSGIISLVAKAVIK